MAERKKWSVAVAPSTDQPKVKLSITMSPDLLAWIRENVGPGRRFGNVSHAVESGIVCMRDAGKP